MAETIACIDCRFEFYFGGKEKEFFESKGFTPPIRCKPCRGKKKQLKQQIGDLIALRNKARDEEREATDSNAKLLS